MDSVDKAILTEEKLRRKDVLHNIDDRGYAVATWAQEKMVRDKADKTVEMLVGLNSVKKEKSKEADYVNWLLNLSGTTGSTDMYPSSIGTLPGEIARFQWTGETFRKSS